MRQPKIHPAVEAALSSKPKSLSQIAKEAGVSKDIVLTSLSNLEAQERARKLANSQWIKSDNFANIWLKRIWI